MTDTHVFEVLFTDDERRARLEAEVPSPWKSPVGTRPFDVTIKGDDEAAMFRIRFAQEIEAAATPSGERAADEFGVVRPCQRIGFDHQRYDPDLSNHQRRRLDERNAVVRVGERHAFHPHRRHRCHSSERHHDQRQPFRRKAG